MILSAEALCEPVKNEQSTGQVEHGRRCGPLVERALVSLSIVVIWFILGGGTLLLFSRHGLAKSFLASRIFGSSC
ncbi:uncharacterized protein LACBIDRAFT_301919 [Laccaria bicolor S238N-H82]|uniref:Predicted protein n=1 Tax=Laccaria bicolor (strain S238N-H82 / ATCC MYA-4686) TaxID=486041 RepID=B0CPX4_LACBS|nr:uncharacterized protein LACBIDRAFT_301919 [Laccaria bicolor S238N-H82]EDR16141.1 predicted protein [Laccaria bicolor S238N-H82]|eukprot:XP_001874349.1 predicted protein [Laccaria bicolor S238N-H82]